MKDIATKSKINLSKFNFNNLIPKEHFKTLALEGNKLFEIQRVFATQFAPLIIKAQLDFLAQFQPILQNLNKIINPSLFKAFKVLKEIKEFKQELDETNRRDKVFTSTFCNNYSIQKIKKMLIDTDKRAIEVYDDIFSDKKNLPILINNWSKKSHFNDDRLNILRDAIKAHIDKKYTLAIPVLLGQLEGILIDSFGITQKQIRNAIDKAFPKKSEEKGLPFFLKTPHIVREILLREVFNPNEKEGYANKGVYPNRHTIQHGVNLTYYKDKFASTRLIMLIDFTSSDDFQAGVERFKSQKGKRDK